MPRLIDGYDGESGALLARFPCECAEDCSQPARPADEAVAYWLKSPRVKWTADLATLRRYLKGFGAWDDLETTTEETIKSRVLWLLACDWREERRR